jgi:hypothetical protein
MAEPGPSGANQYLAAAAELRSAAKWLLASFGAVGAVLIAGVQLTELGHVHHARLWEAIGSIVVGLAGVALSIFTASRVLEPMTATIDLVASEDEFEALRKLVGAHPGMFKGTAGSLTGFVHASSQTLVDADAAYRELEDHPNDQARQIAYRRAEQKRERVEGVATDLLGLAALLAIRGRFVWARRWLLLGGILVVAGAIGFVYFANPAKPTKPPTSARAKIVRVELTPGGRARLHPQLGKRCQLDDIRAVQLRGPASSARVLTFPEAGCRGIEVTLTGALGVVR